MKKFKTGESKVIQLDVFCPLYNASKHLDNLLSGIRRQKRVVVNRIVFGITASSDDTLERVQNIGQEITYFVVDKSEFSHSGVREQGISICTAKIVIMLSQDVDLYDELAFYNLASGITDDVPYSYGRQISIYNGIEKYIRELNYPNSSCLMSQRDIQQFQIKTFFASDAFAAYNRDYFLRVNGYDGKRLMMSEDMYFARKVILRGQSVFYNCEAKVRHSHKYKMKELYKRYYDIGNFFKMNPEFLKYKSTGTGLSLAISVLKKIFVHFDIKSLFLFVPDMCCRYFGKRAGEK